MPSPTHGKFIWYELMTTDMQAAAGFYATVIGWTTKTMPMPGMPGVEYGIFDTRAGDEDCGVAGFMTTPEEMQSEIPPNWTGYVAVDDVDASAAAFEAEGGKILRMPADIPGVGRFAVVADPHGAVVCIMTPVPMDNPPPQPPEGTPGVFGWNELMAGDGRQALDFYGRVFGWTLDHAMDMGPMGEYLIFAHRGKVIGGMMTRPEQVPVPHWVYYVNVASITTAIDTINGQGGSIVFGPQEVPGNSVIVNARDPQGAYFSVVGRR